MVKNEPNLGEIWTQEIRGEHRGLIGGVYIHVLLSEFVEHTRFN